MTVIHIAGAAISVGLLIYLFVALLLPEKLQ
jgi:K+-transporting ATPase KdpF subunit